MNYFLENVNAETNRALGIKHFTLGRLNFTVNQILHPNKHDKMCKIFSGNFFFFEPNKMIKSTLDIYYETIL